MSTKRIIFCTHSSIYSSIVLEKLLADENVTLVGIVNSTRIMHPNYGFIRGAFKQIQASGFAYASYLFMVTDLFEWRQPFFKSKLKSVHKLAAQNNIPLLDTQDINDKQSLAFIKNTQANVLVAAHFDQLVKAPLLNSPDLECLNIHPSILPDYKGVDPVFFALLRKEKESGVTLHKMAETFDTGEILMQKSITLDASRSVFANNCEYFEQGAKLALVWLGGEKAVPIALGKNTQGQYDSWPSREQIKQFKKMKYHLIRISEYFSV